MKRKGIIGLFLTVILTILLVDSQSRITVSQYTLESEILPENFDGYCIVHLSDLHGREFGPGNRRLLTLTAALQPDLIAVTGDLADGEKEIPTMLVLMEQLAALAPCCYVTGNHEWALDDVPAWKVQLRDRGVTVLDNRWQVAVHSGDAIVIGGVDDPNGPADMITPEKLVSRVRAEYPRAFFLLLGHRNYWPEEYPALEADLILCGHGHGGLIRLPGLGGVFGTNRDLFPSCTEGMHPMENGCTVVSRGLGNSPGTIRLFNNPEIVVINLKKI